MGEEPLRVGALGAANITPRALIEPAARSDEVDVVAVAARDPRRAAQFAADHGIGRVHRTYDDLIADPAVDAIYIGLPISHHCRWTLAALAAGKHVLCEKSFASNADEARRMADAAGAAGLVAVDAFHYRYHPLFERAIEVYGSGVLGEIESMRAVFTIGVDRPDDIRMDYATAGGVTMDIGCYPISWLRHLTGTEPVAVTATAVEGPPDVDITLTAELTFPDGVIGTAHGSMAAGEPFVAEIDVIGGDGRMHVVNPLAPQRGHHLDLTVGGETTREQATDRSTFDFQLDAFVRAVRDGETLPTDAADAVAQMQVIDDCYRAAGMSPRGMGDR